MAWIRHLVAIAVLGILAAVPSTALAGSVHREDLAGLVVYGSADCPAVEPITITTGHTVTLYETWIDPSGKEHYRSFTLVQFSGVGDSGRHYSSIARVHQNYVYDPDGVALFATNWISRQRLVAQGDISYLDFTAHSTRTPDGVVAVEWWKLEIACR